MTQDRIDFLLGNINKENVVFSAPSLQWIFPGATFTCNGNIQGWIFGAQFGLNTSSSMELQIWRPTGAKGSYTKVWKTVVSERNASNTYYHLLPSAFSFRAGDVLGYYQPSRSKLLLLLESSYNVDAAYNVTSSNAASYITFDDSSVNSTSFKAIINPITGKVIEEAYLPSFIFPLLFCRLCKLCSGFYGF